MFRPALRYYGGKWRIAPWIIENFPYHYCYVEPFGGSAGVLLQKPPARFEVYNDVDREVVTFFKVLRERENELIRAIQFTPWSRDELRESYQNNGVDDLEMARRFYVRCWQSFGHGNGGWRYQHSNNGYSIIDHWNEPENLYQIAARLKQVQIENDEALAVIDRFDQPDTLFYVDPPYVHSTRSKNNMYSVELSNHDHSGLAAKLNSVRGKVVVSGYDSELYNQLYKGWEKRQKKTQDNKTRDRIEVLWLNQAAIINGKLF